MPQLEKGGKWVFGWVIVGADRRIRIPQEAWSEYGFEAGQDAIFLKGSITSGGFGIAPKERIPEILTGRSLCTERFQDSRLIRIPGGVDVAPWQKLLAVRGSGHALGFLAQGPIFELALRFPALTQSLP
ncbi:MAG: hypothetical protein JW846_06805 [Dehalococcoidia bacterium]|nr:hypothetical protein [Dehalococcoidia bacterium]